MPPDDPSGKLYDDGGSTEPTSVLEASRIQSATRNDAVLRQEGLTEPASAAFDADAGVSAASSSPAEDAHQSKQHSEQHADALEETQDIFATSSLHADGGISIGAIHAATRTLILIIITAESQALSVSRMLPLLQIPQVAFCPVCSIP